MIRQRIYIHRYNWDVIVFYDTTYRDAYPILETLEDIGVDEKSYRLAEENLYAGLVDTGLTFTNAADRVSVMVLSRTSTKTEFANTWFHELIHCSIHIARANMLSPDEEPMAYLGGELARAMQSMAAIFLCPNCGV